MSGLLHLALSFKTKPKTFKYYSGTRWCLLTVPALAMVSSWSTWPTQHCLLITLLSIESARLAHKAQAPHPQDYESPTRGALQDSRFSKFSSDVVSLLTPCPGPSFSEKVMANMRGDEQRSQPSHSPKPSQSENITGRAVSSSYEPPKNKII